MSNTSNSQAEKGSRFWMQKIFNDDKLRQRFEPLIGESLCRYSPPVSECYKEYQLKEPRILQNVLKLSKEDFRAKFSFWATNQPHWDAIATSVDGTILYLFEAKANLKEVQSKISARNNNSIKIITDSMYSVFKTMSTATADFDNWLNKYYQLGNRLTFIYYMNQMHFPKIRRVELILLNIINDSTYIPTSLKDWTRHYEDVFEVMTGNKFPPANVKLLYFSGDSGGDYNDG